MKLELRDLRPVEAEFKLSSFPDKTFTLRKFTLAVQIWIKEKYTDEALNGILENRSLPELSEIAYHMLKDKSSFPTLDDFRDAIVTYQDKEAFVLAFIHSVGVSQPIMEKLAKEYDSGNAESLSEQSTGAKSTTLSAANTGTI